MGRVAVLFNQLGPYHVARLRELGMGGDVVVIELTRHGSNYAWEKVEIEGPVRRVTLLEDDSPHTYHGRVVAKLVKGALQRERPSCVVTANWASAAALSALEWCQVADVPAVVMSDSQACDKRRTTCGESLKKRIVKLFSTSLVAGQPHASYLRQLGMAPERIFTGFDVVDNRHFSHKADDARREARSMRRRLGLPRDYLLASSRFVPKKNLSRLIDAYARYRNRVGSHAWKLVVLGDGELRPGLELQCKTLELEEDVLLPGFKQIDILPAYYGLASCLVHASTTEQWGLVVNEAMAAGLPVLVSDRCGCAVDLVQEGRNGYTFDPYNVAELADRMTDFAAGRHDLAAMGRASREVIGDWSPRRFAENLWQAVDVAMSVPRPQARTWDRVLLRALARR